MTARLGTQPSQPGGGKSTRPEETDHWKVEKDPAHPDDRKKDQWKATKGGYQTPKPIDAPQGFAELNLWIKDMREWGIMMQEAVVELRERVEELETRCP